jgi:hypothetical protein
LYFSLKALGYTVKLWSLCFTIEEKVQQGEFVSPNCYKVTSSTKNPGWQPYFPEKFLCEWFKEAENDDSVAVYTMCRTGVIPAVAAMREVIKKEGIDTVVLIDGGTDSLMRGDEQELGSPQEDMLSIASLDSITDIKEDNKLLVCLGFGIDAFHGVSHGRFLENVANLILTGGFLGVFTCMKEMPEVQKFISLCKYVFHRMDDSSIVASSVIAAIEGQFGDYHSSERTVGSELFINELMAQYWCFKLGPVAKSIHYLDSLKATTRMQELAQGINNYRRGLDPKQIRMRIQYPH